MRGGLQLAQRVVHGPSGVEGAARAVQPQEVPLQGQDHGLRILAARNAAVAFVDRCRSATRRGGHHDPVERQLGRVADGGLHVAFLDRALVQGIERELLDLGARQAAVGAEASYQHRPRFRRDLQLRRGQHLADHAFEVARLVREAGDGGRVRRFLEQAAQGVVGAQTAGLHDQETLQRAALDQRFQRRGGDAPARCRAHDLATAEHGRGLQLNGDAARIILQAGVVDAQDLAGGVLALGEAFGQPCRPFGHQARVGAIQQHRRWGRGGGLLEALQEGVGLVSLDGDHDMSSGNRAEHVFSPIDARTRQTRNWLA